ncbi:protein kinase, putative [Bodo saltans]|uniref:Protein kinase, putative n=1 Tax=Bodo saltans TaxID=75058 RepID=A0A0S4JV43_BODSA|nr:protein kinase, putative [Bodo saltans]|eukprot:CUG92447.1 protein kinase, putative [Bodo saltans]
MELSSLYSPTHRTSVPKLSTSFAVPVENRFPFVELRLKLLDIDEEFFSSSCGDAAAASKAAGRLSGDATTTALLTMYRLLFEFVDAHAPPNVDSETSSRSPNSPRNAKEHGNNESSRSGFLFPHPSDTHHVSRTPSMMSFGGTSMVSLHKPPVQVTTSFQKSLDTESGNKKINEYILLGELGRGAQGKVKLAFDTERNVLRAVKIIRRPPDVDGHGIGKMLASESRKRIEQEIAITKRLRHKNLVSLYEVIDDPEMDKLYLVLQHAGNGPLTKFRGGIFCDRYEEGRCASFARQLSAGLMYLHQHGVVHRDIKPENILRGEGDEVLLADFGVSEMLATDIPTDEEEATEAWTRRRRELRDQGVVVNAGSRGTPAFLAPELIALRNLEAEPEQHSGELIDIWALGVTLFALLCGRLPWVVEDTTLPTDDPDKFRFHTKSYFAAVSHESPMFPPLPQLVRQKTFLKQHYDFEELEQPLPRHWVELIESMLHKDPSERPTIFTLRRKVKLFRSPGTQGLGFRRASIDHSSEADIARAVKEVSVVISDTSTPKHAKEVATEKKTTPTCAPLAVTPLSAIDIAAKTSPPEAAVLVPSPPGELNTSPSFSVRRRRTRQWTEE